VCCAVIKLQTGLGTYGPVKIEGRSILESILSHLNGSLEKAVTFDDIET